MDIPVAIWFGLHLDATVMDAAVETGNCRCYDQLKMVIAAVAQSAVAAQIGHHADHSVEWQMALVKFERSLVAEVIVAKLIKFYHFICIASVRSFFSFSILLRLTFITHLN